MGNVLLAVALAGAGDLPLGWAGFCEAMDRTVPLEKLEINLAAFAKSLAMLNDC